VFVFLILSHVFISVQLTRIVVATNGKRRRTENKLYTKDEKKGKKKRKEKEM